MEQTAEEYREQVLRRAMEELKVSATEVVSRIMSDLYTDYLPHVDTDTESNIGFRVDGVINNLVAGKFTDNGSAYVWVEDGYGRTHQVNLASWHNVVAPLIDKYGEVIKCERIKQLESEVKSLKDQLFNRSRY